MLKILTLNWDGKDKLEKLYPGLIKSLDGVDYEWLVKDNNSTDGSKEYIKSLNNPNIKLIECSHNFDNFSKGCNVLFKEASPNDEDFILLLNNDVIFNDELSLKNMISIIDKDHSVGVVGAKLKYTGTNKIQHAGVVFNNSMMPFHFRANQIDDSDSSKNREFQAVTGAVWLTKAKYYKQICKDSEGLDQNYHWCFDDVSACLSIKYNLNKKIIYCGKTNIFHEESASLKKNPANKLFMKHNVNLLLNMWKDKCKADAAIYLKDKKYNLYK